MDSIANFPHKHPKKEETMKRLILLLAILGLSLMGCNKAPESEAKSGGKKLVIGFMPKSKGNGYFLSCKQGGEAASRELGVEMIFDGPTEPDPAKQNEIIEQWINLGVDAIAVACENRDGISTALRKARAKRIRVVTYDADAQPDARDFFVNQATVDGIGKALTDEAARLTGGSGEYAIITASLTAGNMIAWQQAIERRNEEKYPNLKRVALRPCDDLKDKAQSETTALLSANPNLKLIMAICSPAVPGAAEAILQAGKAGKVKLIGLGLPNENKRYVHGGVTDTVILWKTRDLGYLAIEAAAALVRGELKAGANQFKAGTLGEFRIAGDSILLGEPFKFTKENIDQFDF
jgi:ABC-type sugar transport system substrate-binding protein